MEKLNQVAINAGRISPLTFQLKTKWDETKGDEKELCIEKASEACSLVCGVIAPKAGKELFHSCFTPDKETNYGRPCATNVSLQQRHDEESEDPDSEPVFLSISSEDASEDP